MLVGASAPPGAAPYAAAFLPGMALGANVLATADDPRAIAARGVLWGSGATQRLDALFDVDANGAGSVGPLELRGKSGSLYARVALGGPKGGTFGVVDAHDFAIAPMHARIGAQLFGERTRDAIQTAGSARLFAPAWGAAQAHGRVAFANGALRGALFGSMGSTASFAATVAGTPRTPRVSGTVVVAGGRYRNFDVNGSAGREFRSRRARRAQRGGRIGPALRRRRGQDPRHRARRGSRTALRSHRAGSFVRRRHARRERAAAQRESRRGQHRRKRSRRRIRFGARPERHDRRSGGLDQRTGLSRLSRRRRRELGFSSR